MDALFVTGKLAVLDIKDTGVLACQVKHKPTPGTCPEEFKKRERGQ